MNILVLNAGSSSQKSSLYVLDNSLQKLPADPVEPAWEGEIDLGHAEGKAKIKVETSSGQALEETLDCGDSPQERLRHAATQQLLATLWQGPTQVIAQPEDIDAVGHRVVHGGQTYQQATLIDEAVKAKIAELTPLAPNHNPVNLAGIEIAQALLGPKIPQYAVFDTAFHSTLPAAAAQYPVPQIWAEQGIRRYGFHGISHQYCAYRAAHLLKRQADELRLVIAHLGNGCSLSAVRGGRSVDTTMGFTPLEGLMMGTRSGSIDPGILTYLMREQIYTHEQIDQQLNKDAGLKGISGLSSDMRVIVSAMLEGHAAAKLAFDMYVHRLRKGIAAMTASLGGLDALVFTAGVGENATIVRAEACAGFGFLGLEISEEKNMQESGERDISTATSNLPVLIIHTQEDWQIAKECWTLNRLPRFPY